jgi:hypothetical protein
VAVAAPGTRPVLSRAELGKGPLVGGVSLPLALAELGLIDEYEILVQPRLAGHGSTMFDRIPVEIRP